MDDVFRAIARREPRMGKGPKWWEHDKATGRVCDRYVQIGKDRLATAACIQIKDRGDEATGRTSVDHIDMRQELVAAIGKIALEPHLLAVRVRWPKPSDAKRLVVPVQAHANDVTNLSLHIRRLLSAELQPSGQRRASDQNLPLCVERRRGAFNP
jgi:hypothetical protein